MTRHTKLTALILSGGAFTKAQRNYIIDPSFIYGAPGAGGEIGGGFVGPSYGENAGGSFYPPAGALYLRPQNFKDQFVEIPTFGASEVSQQPLYPADPFDSMYHPTGGSTHYLNRYPIQQLYLQPLHIEEPFFYSDGSYQIQPVVAQPMVGPLYSPQPLAAPMPAGIGQNYPLAPTRPVYPNWPSYNSQPSIDANMEMAPRDSEPSPGSISDASYITQIEQPIAAPTNSSQSDVQDEEDDTAGGLIPKEIAEAAASLGLRPRRVWDRETVIDLLSVKETETDEDDEDDEEDEDDEDLEDEEDEDDERNDAQETEEGETEEDWVTDKDRETGKEPTDEDRESWYRTKGNSIE